MALEIVKSIGATIGVDRIGPASARINMVAVACGGGASLFQQLGDPAAAAVSFMDIRGYGASKIEQKIDPTADSPVELNSYLDDIDAVFDAAKAKTGVLFGYSHAGYFTTAYALARPERVTGLILSEPALFNDKADLLHRVQIMRKGNAVAALRSMFRYIAPTVAHTEASAKAAAETILKHVNDEHALTADWLVRANHPLSEWDLQQLSVPILLIGGTKSHAKDTVLRMAKLQPHASVAWVRGAQHFDLMSDNYKSQVSPAIASFIAGL